VPSPGDVTTALLDELPEPLRQSEYSLAVDDCRRLGPIEEKPGLSLMELSQYARALNTIATHASAAPQRRQANQSDFELLKRYGDVPVKAPELRRVIRKLEFEVDPAKLD